MRPEQDAAFTQVTGSVKGFAKDKKAHPPAASKAKEAQDAALAPTGDLAGQAKAAKVDTMDAQRPGTFDKKAFIAAVKTAIEAKSPKTLKEADDYKESGKAGEVKGEVKGLVTAGKEGQAKDIETATEAPPDQSKAVAEAGHADGPGGARQPVVDPGGRRCAEAGAAEQLNLAAGKHRPTRRWPTPRSREAQLAKSNEPEFQQALADKQAAAAHADTAPGEFRKHEERGHRAGQGRGRGRRPRPASPACRAQGGGAGQTGRGQGQDEVEGRGEARRGHHQDPGHLHRHRGAT